MLTLNSFTSGSATEDTPWNMIAKAIVVTVVVFLAAGVVAGWAWQQFSPLAQYTVDENGGALGEEQMTRIFGPDGTFTAIGFLAARDRDARRVPRRRHLLGCRHAARPRSAAAAAAGGQAR